PSHELDQLLANRQAEPRAFVRAPRALVDLGKSLEQPDLRALRDSGARILARHLEHWGGAQRHARARPPRQHTHLHRAAVGELDGIADQISEDLPEAVA